MKLLITITTSLLMALFWGPSVNVSYSQTQYVPEESSKLWIEGRSNVNRFQCDAKEYEGVAIIYPALMQSPSGVGEQPPDENELSIRIDIGVDGFECGRSRMNRDLREALKSDDFPEITFIYGNAEPISEFETDDGGTGVMLEVTGSLTVAGVTRDVKFEMEGLYLDDGRIRAKGFKEIRMTDFGVDPPTALLGMVKAEDELSVHFDLIARQKKNP